MPADSGEPAVAEANGLHAFISYARADSQAALALKRELEQAGHAVFLDTRSLRAVTTRADEG